MSVTFPDVLLRKCQDLNDWARFMIQMFITLYTVILTINGAALAWFFTRKGSPRERNTEIMIVLWLFAVWNLISIYPTYMTWASVHMTSVEIATTTRLLYTDPSIYNAATATKLSLDELSRSPIPAAPLRWGFVSAGVTFASLVGLWICLACMRKKASRVP